MHLPDFESPNLTEWWSGQQARLFVDILKQKPDGMFLLHNSPKLKNTNCSLEGLSFAPALILGNQTICPLAKHVGLGDRAHLKVHNNYGIGHARAANFTLVFSHSSSPVKEESSHLVGVIAG